IGEKTARALIQRFGSLEAALERANEVENSRQRASLIENREQILMSKRLVTADASVPVEVNWDDLAVKPADRPALIPLLKELEFTAMVKNYLPEDSDPAVEVVRAEQPPVVGDRIFIDVGEDAIALWTGQGAISEVPLSGGVAELLVNPSVN